MKTTDNPIQIMMLALALMAGIAHGQQESTASQGEKLFNSHCAICHSVGGTGGRGPALTVPMFRNAPTNADLKSIIQGGIPGTEMPGVWSINSQEIDALADYVRSLGRTEAVPLPGDPMNGKRLYKENDCANCHIVSGAGRGIGPELTQIGLSRSAGFLRKALIAPEADLPNGYALVQATMRDGKFVEGIRLNEDSFTVQLRDINGDYFSLNKLDLKSYRKSLKRSIMPRYNRLSKDELDDLVAYMASLRDETK